MDCARPVAAASSTMSNTVSRAWKLATRGPAGPAPRPHELDVAGRTPLDPVPPGPRAEHGRPGRRAEARTVASMSIGRAGPGLSSGWPARPGAAPRSAWRVGCRHRSRCRAPPPRARSCAYRTPRGPLRRPEPAATPAPVSSAKRNANVVPARSTSWLAITVAMISRRSRWPCICSRERAGRGVGKVALEVVTQIRVLRQVGLEQRLVQADLGVGHQRRPARGRQAPMAGRRATSSSRWADPQAHGQPRTARVGGSGARGRRPSRPPGRWRCSAPGSACSCRTGRAGRPLRSSGQQAVALVAVISPAATSSPGGS